MKVVDRKTGKTVEAADDETTQAAIASGAYSLRHGQTVPVVSPDGQMGTIPAEDASAAFSQGYSLTSATDVRRAELNAKHGTLGGIAKTSAEGAARGLTFGLSDAAIRAADPEWANAAAERAEANPMTAGASELAGAVAPMLFTGGASSAASGGARAAEGGLALGRLAEGAGAVGRAAEVGVEAARAGEMWPHRYCPEPHRLPPHHS